MKKFLLLLALCSLLLGVLAWYGWERYRNFLAAPLNIPADGQVFELDSGATGSGIVQQLAVMGLTRPGWEWRLLMRLEPHIYQTGEYLLEAGSGPQAVLGKLASGRGHPVPLYAGGRLDIQATVRSPGGKHDIAARTGTRC